MLAGIGYNAPVTALPDAETVPDTQPLVFLLRQPAAAMAAAEPEWLAPSETAFLRSLTVDKRRDDWLLGRWAAKRLVQAVLADRGYGRIDLASIAVDKSTDGAPLITLSEVPNPPPLTLSLSHSHGVAVAALVMAEAWPLGVDLEWCEERHPALVSDYFTEIEQADLAAFPDGVCTTAVNAIWSGKEAALKAVRLGLTQDTRAVTVRLSSHPTPTGWSRLTIAWDERRFAGPPLEGWWQVREGFVLTVAYRRDPAAEAHSNR